MSITDRITQRMRAMGMTWSSLAEPSGVNRRTLYEYRRTGWYDVRLYTLLRISYALGVSVGWLVDGAGESPVLEPAVSVQAPRHPTGCTCYDCLWQSPSAGRS